MVVTLAQLQPLVGEQIEVRTLHGVVPLTLVEVVERPQRGLPARFMSPLSLVLQGPAHIILSQDTYPMSHPAIGEHSWGLVQIAPYSVAGYEDSTLPLYEIVFIQANEAVAAPASA